MRYVGPVDGVRVGVIQGAHLRRVALAEGLVGAAVRPESILERWIVPQPQLHPLAHL